MKPIVVLMLALATGAAAASPQIAAKAGCNACHQPDKKAVGPSYREIAAKYQGRADAATVLAERVRKGGSGVWGAVPMPATDRKLLSDADLKAVVAWVLKTP